MRTARCICSCGIEVRYRKFNRSIKRYADASRPANRMLFFIDKCMKIDRVRGDLYDGSTVACTEEKLVVIGLTVFEPWTAIHRSRKGVEDFDTRILYVGDG